MESPHPKKTSEQPLQWLAALGVPYPHRSGFQRSKRIFLTYRVARPMSSLRVAVAQIDISLGDVPRNVAKIRRYTRLAADNGARLIVFPECASTGYIFDDPAEATRIAEPIPGPTTE